MEVKLFVADANGTCVDGVAAAEEAVRAEAAAAIRLVSSARLRCSSAALAATCAAAASSSPRLLASAWKQNEIVDYFKDKAFL